MGNILKLTIILCILTFISCSKSEFTKEKPTIPEAFEIDIDDNGVVDYSINYYEVLVEGPAISGGIVGVFEPHDDNKILNERQGRDLFLRNLEDITQDVAEPLFWSSTSNISIISLYNHSPTDEWRTKWDVNSEIEHSSYFIGVKMIRENDSQLGWVELELNTSDGNITVIDKGML